MNKLIIPYTEKEHPVFGKINRPLVRLALFSECIGKWLEVGQVLADTGADISIIPLPLGQVLVSDVGNGEPLHVGGALSSDKFVNAFVHRIPARIGNHSFEMPMAVSLSSAIPPIWGRQEALDRFSISFIRGKEMVLEIKDSGNA